METRAAKRRRRADEASRDRISDLPDAIIHHILSFLSLKFIAQTSILSKQWSNIWRSCPTLDFSDVRCRKIVENKQGYQVWEPEDGEWDFVLGVLWRRHTQSNIKVFRLRGHVGSRWLNRIILHMVNQRVEVLELNLRMGDYFELPRLLLTCGTLKKLRLHFCQDYPDRVMVHALSSGSLTSLSMENVVFPASSRFPKNKNDVFSSCNFPNLRSLHLNDCRGFVDLEVYCSRLEDLTLGGLELRSLHIFGTNLATITMKRCFKTIVEDNWVKILAPNVRNFYWHRSSFCESFSIERMIHCEDVEILYGTQIMNTGKLRSVANLFSAVAHCRSIYMGFTVAKLFAQMKNSVGNILLSYINLKDLRFLTSLLKEQILGIIGLLRTTPVLQSLTIIVDPSLVLKLNKWNISLLDDANVSEEEYWISQVDVLRPFFNSIKTIVIDVKGDVPQIAVILVKFLLKYGVELEEVKLNCRNSTEETSIWGLKIGLQLGDFPKASGKVKIHLH